MMTFENYTLELKITLLKNCRTHEEKTKSYKFVKCFVFSTINMFVYFKITSLINHFATSKKEKIRREKVSHT